MTQLQTLGKLREQERDAAQKVFADHERVVTEIKGVIAEIIAEQSALTAKMSEERQNATLDPVGRNALTNFLRAAEIESKDLAARRTEHEAQLADALIRLDLAREDLIDAQQQLKAVENEVDKRNAESKKKQQKLEDAQLDEIATKQWWEKS